MERPGIQSNLIPNPGIYHECTTSKLLVITVKLIFVGKTNVRRVRNNRLFMVKSLNPIRAFNRLVNHFCEYCASMDVLNTEASLTNNCAVGLLTTTLATLRI